MVFSLLIRSLNNIFSKQRHRNMELKRLEVYQKEYRESSSATIEKADAKYKEIYSAWCTRSVEKWPRLLNFQRNHRCFARISLAVVDCYLLAGP